MKRHTFYIIGLLFVVSVLLTVVNYFWIKNNISHIPPPWDAAFYIYLGLNDYDALINGGPIKFVRTFIGQAPNLAPLFPATATPLFAVFGTDINTAYMVNCIYIFILFVAVFFIADHLSGRKAGFMSVFLVGTFPAVIAFSRDFLFEFPLAALTALSYLFLIKSDGFQKRKEAVFFGICSGLSVLTKTMGVVFFVMPFFYGLIVFIRSKKAQTIRKNFLLACLSAFLVAAIFYLPNVKEIFGYLFYFGVGKGAENFNMGITDMSSLQYWTVYLHMIAERGISYGYAILFIISFLVFLFSRGKNLSVNYLLVWLWFLCGYLLLSVPQNKGAERYALPILSSLAVLMGVHISKISPKSLRIIAIAAALVIGATDYVYQTDAKDCDYDRFSFEGYQMLMPIHVNCAIKDELRLDYGQDWNIAQILRFMDASNPNKRNPIRVLVAVDHHLLNGNNLTLFAKMEKLKGKLTSEFRFETVVHRPEEEIGRLISESDFIITKTGMQGPHFSNVNNAFVKKIVNNMIPMKSYVMSDGSTVHLYSGLDKEKLSD
jgi:hypothetical protein